MMVCHLADAWTDVQMSSDRCADTLNNKSLQMAVQKVKVPDDLTNKLLVKS